MASEKIINLANLITTIRLALVPFFLYFFAENFMSLSLILFLLISLGDLLDGYVARKLKQQTYFGKLYDGLVDTLFLFGSLIVIFLAGKLKLIYLILLFLPRLYVFSRSLVLYFKGKKYYDTNFYRKWAGLFIFLLIFFAMFKDNINLIALIVIIINYGALVIEEIYGKK